MESTYAFDYSVIAWFLIGGCAFVAVTLGMSRLLQHRAPGTVKSEIYECGVEPVGPSWVQLKLGYYVYALLFVLFDVETAFLYPWAVAIRASAPVRARRDDRLPGRSSASGSRTRGRRAR